MFGRLLIANRGEIACRIIGTCKRLGIETVAVYSDADRDAHHVALADRAIHIGGAAPADSYLRADRIIAAACASGCEAVHPGYGFLSESPDFVEAVEAAGLVFVGPSAEAIRVMGLKDAAKARMEGAGVAVVPGYHGSDQSPERLAAEAAKIGYPILIKAVAGGGGKGMRAVSDPGDFAFALEGARAEARGAFGNDAVLIEKLITKPRHIEIQVFGDGNRAVHLFERDCSLQRRHQKVIEETPAPGMTAQMRDAMGRAAVQAAEAIGYCGAGTVEFIVDASDGLRPDRFWFMEMNTRLQVEHPVTEAVTGLDLVELQLRVAAGAPLELAQSDIRLDGHAIEARLYAEDVPAGFLPVTGRLAVLDFPPDVRVDTGVRAGDEISPHYDPMIAKLIVHGKTRSQALSRLAVALRRSRVAGTVTNHAFLLKLAESGAFASGDIDTGLIDRELESLAARPDPDTAIRAIAAVAALGLPNPGASGFTLWQPLGWTAVVFDAPVRVVPTARGRFGVSGADWSHLVEYRDDAWWIDGAKSPATVVRDSSDISVFLGFAYVTPVQNGLADRGSLDVTTDSIRAPMPGVVSRISAVPGGAVQAGDALAVVEAMKMEHALRAPRDGVVAELFVEEGAQVEAGAALVRLEPVEGSTDHA